MHTVEQAKKLQCRVVGIYTHQVRTRIPGNIVGMNGSTEQVEVHIKSLECCADQCGHWVWEAPGEPTSEPLGRCGLAR